MKCILMILVLSTSMQAYSMDQKNIAEEQKKYHLIGMANALRIRHYQSELEKNLTLFGLKILNINNNIEIEKELREKLASILAGLDYVSDNEEDSDESTSFDEKIDDAEHSYNALLGIKNKIDQECHFASNIMSTIENLEQKLVTMALVNQPKTNLRLSLMKKYSELHPNNT